MDIDINRVNLTERDIEDWIYENRTEIPHNYHGWITHWFGRQYQLPSGIADLIGMRTNGVAVVIEVKNVAINKAAITQVCRYAADLRELIANRMDYPIRESDTYPYIEKILIGPSIDSQTFGEAKACGVEVITFIPRLSLCVRRLDWTDEYEKERESKLEVLARNEVWNMYGELVADAVRARYEHPQIESTIATNDRYDDLLDAIATEQDVNPDEDIEF